MLPPASPEEFPMPPLKTNPKRLLICGLALCCLAGWGDAQPGDGKPGTDGPLPPGAVRRLGTTQFRAGQRILSLAYFPNDRWLASGCGNGPVLVWQPDRGRHK